MVDVDVQPTYASVIIKNKTTRLTFPEEIKPDEGEAQRSQVNGTLKLILPKVDPTSALKSHKYAEQERIQKENEKREQEQEQAKSKMRNKLGFAMLEAAENASNRVDFRNIVKKEPSPAKLKADNAAENIEDENYIDDSEAPPLE